MLRKIDTDTRVLSSAIADGINSFVREILIPRGLIAGEVWSSEELNKLKHQTAKTVALRWGVSWFDD